MAHIFTFRKFSFLLKRAFSSSVNLISSLSFRILFAIGNPPLNVFRGLRVHPNKLKLIKKKQIPKGCLGMATVFDKFYKVQNFFPYAIPIVLDNEPPRM